MAMPFPGGQGRLSASVLARPARASLENGVHSDSLAQPMPSPAIGGRPGGQIIAGLLDQAVRRRDPNARILLAVIARTGHNVRATNG